MQAIFCMWFSLALGASGETNGCFDSTSLLQRSLSRHDGTDNTLECPCIMGEWEEWGDCSASCGGGTQNRTRPVKKKATNGTKCNNSQEEPCNHQSCPSDCVVTNWQEWGDCSETCTAKGEQSIRHRKRILKSPATHGGKDDCKPLEEEDHCKWIKDCPPTPCEWKSWGDWTDCDNTCGGGTRSRERTINKQATYGGEKCNETHASDSEPCNTQCCPVDCKLSTWGEWSPCKGECNCSDVNGCGNGTTQRTRVPNPKASCGGKKCDEKEQHKDCNTDRPCPQNCTWGDWTEWSSCSVTCAKGVITRTRDKLIEEKYGGKCNNTDTQTLNCTEDDCPVDCKYSWDDWSACTRTCGGGTQTRKIIITTHPSEGGVPCPTSPKTQDCNTEPDCPCTYGPWGEWSPCSKTCLEGEKTRKREPDSEEGYGLEKCKKSDETDTISCEEMDCCPVDCVLGPWTEWSECPCDGGSKTRTRKPTTEPECGGAQCGDEEETVDCPYVPCPIPCKWKDWSEWTDCDTSCGGGNETRTRESTEEKYGGKKCTGPKIEHRPCVPETCCPKDCKWKAWSTWSDCPVTCDGGEQIRTRDVEEASCGGAKCEGEDEDKKDCGTEPCPCCYHDWSDWKCVPGTKTKQRTREVDAQWKEENESTHRCDDTKETRDSMDCGKVDPNNLDVEVCAHVKDASNHENKIEGAQVTNADGETATTKDDGKFCFTLPVGEVTLTAEKEGYVTEKVVREVVQGESTINDIEMSSVLEQGQWRIVMAWEKQPWDLDSWTMFGKGTTDEQKFFYYYASAGGWDAEKCDRDCASQLPKSCVMNWIYKKNAVAKPKVHQPVTCSTNGVTAFMDQDNKNISTNHYAETTTLSGVDGTKCGDDCNIHFCVYQYAPRPTPNQIRESSATVQVYNGDGGKAKKVGHFTMGKDGIVKDLNDKAKGTSFAGASQWFVFSIDAKTNEVIPCTDLASECAQMPCGQHYGR